MKTNRVLTGLVFTMALLALPSRAQGPMVTGAGNFIHAVGEVERSVKFYRDVLGMELQRPLGPPQETAQVMSMYDAVGAKFRAGNAQIPGVAMRIELVEFQGVERKPVLRTLGTAGASVLMLTVKDLAPVLTRLSAAGIEAKVKKGCDARGISVADPDGFPVVIAERSQSTGSPAAVAAASNFTGMKFGYTVSDEAAMAAVFSALKLPVKQADSACKPVEEELAKARGRAQVVTLPDGFQYWLMKGKPEKTPVLPRPRDPGATVLRLLVTGAPEAAEALGQAGLKIVSAGGVLQTLPPAGLKAGILRAPDGLLVQVVK
jgi:catechol 2,3-dioxygenase-like lactoylglutathione lyase family enzyme